MSYSYRDIGAIGIANVSVLTAIILWRSVRFVQLSDQSNLSKHQKLKKLLLHTCLFMAPIFDLPLYIGFIVMNRYMITLYAFHKLSAATLFVAISITIYDWARVLQDIDRNTSRIILGRKMNLPNIINDRSLYIVNTISLSLALINFVYIFYVNDLSDYLNSYIHVIGLFVQVFVSFLLTACLLYAGLKLYLRIKGLTDRTLNNRFVMTPSSPQVATTEINFSREFRSALRSLNIVMATCSFCIFIQMLILTLNYALGYSNSQSAYVGPFYFYWTFYGWLPLDGPILALLYLSRNGYARNRGNTAATRPELSQVPSRNIFSRQTSQDSESTLDAKLLAEEQITYVSNMDNGTHSSNDGSGSMFFAEELVGFTNPETSVSYMHGNSRLHYNRASAATEGSQRIGISVGSSDSSEFTRNVGKSEERQPVREEPRYESEYLLAETD